VVVRDRDRTALASSDADRLIRWFSRAKIGGDPDERFKHRLTSWDEQPAKDLAVAAGAAIGSASA
jgi:hypothetical protein